MMTFTHRSFLIFINHLNIGYENNNIINCIPIDNIVIVISCHWVIEFDVGSMNSVQEFLNRSIILCNMYLLMLALGHRTLQSTFVIVFSKIRLVANV